MSKYKIRFKDVQDGCTLYGIHITRGEIVEVFEANPGLMASITFEGRKVLARAE